MERKSQFTSKRLFWMVSAILMMLICIMLVSIHARASLNADEIKVVSERWKESHDYPIMPGDEGWEGLGYDEVLKVINPPEEVLISLSTKELADLMLRWPLLDEMYGFEYEKYFQLLSGKCTIFAELRWRKGGTKEILNALRDAPFDIETVMTNGGSLADEFVCEYVSVFGSEFTYEEAALYQAVWDERNEKYYSMLPERSYGSSFVEIVVSKDNKERPSASELWEAWRDYQEYPILPGDDNWDRFDERTKIRILNPPDDVLEDLTTEELVNLVLKYPFLRYYALYDSTRQYFNSFLEKDCKVFKEFIGRKDSAECLLKAYEVNAVDIAELNEKGLSSEEASVIAEIFMCKYIDYYGSWRFQEADISRYVEIYKKKSITIYDEIEDEEVRKAFDTTLSQTRLEESPNPYINEDVTDNVPKGKESKAGIYGVLAVIIVFILAVTFYVVTITKSKKS